MLDCKRHTHVALTTVENDWIDPTVVRPGGELDPTSGLYEWYEMTPEAQVGQRVRRLREQRGWSQEEVGRQLARWGFKMHQTTVAKLENGARPIRLNEVAALARLFAVSMADLWDDEAVSDEQQILEARLTDLQAQLRYAQQAEAVAARSHADARARLEAVQSELTTAMGELGGVRRGEHRSKA